MQIHFAFALKSDTLYHHVILLRNFHSERCIIIVIKHSLKPIDYSVKFIIKRFIIRAGTGGGVEEKSFRKLIVGCMERFSFCFRTSIMR